MSIKFKGLIFALSPAFLADVAAKGHVATAIPAGENGEILEVLFVYGLNDEEVLAYIDRHLKPQGVVDNVELPKTMQ